MVLYPTLDSILYSLPKPAVPRNRSSRKEPESLEGLLEEKVRCLSEILRKILQDIDRRNDLSVDIIYGIEQHYCHLKSKLLRLEFWELGTNAGVDARRSSLERQLDALKQAKRQERVQCWQDISVLKKEFRTWLKQYRDLVQRARLISAEL